MPLVNVPPNFSPTQVEFTARKKGAAKEVKALKRSVEGALHLRPGPVYLTRDEMEHLKAHRPEIHSRLQFIALTEDEREEIKAPERAPVEEPPAAEKPEPQDDRAPSGAGRGRSKGS